MGGAMVTAPRRAGRGAWTSEVRGGASIEPCAKETDSLRRCVVGLSCCGGGTTGDDAAEDLVVLVEARVRVSFRGPQLLINPCHSWPRHVTS